MSFIDDYVEYAVEFTDAPVILHHRIAMSLISTVVNRKVWIVQGMKRIYPNLWTLIITPSSFFRKSYSMEIAEDLLREAAPMLLLPKEFSHERLIEMLQERPQSLMVFDEFKNFLELMKTTYAALSKGVITSLFGCPSVYDRSTKTKEVRIENPFLNILTASTIDWIKNSVNEDDVAGGFMPRFLIVLAST